MTNKSCVAVQRIPSMGSFFEIQLTTPCSAPVPPAFFVLIKNRLEAIEAEMSLYQTSSPIQQLNGKGEFKNAPQHFVRVLQKSLEMAAKTDGLFDVSIATPREISATWKDIVLSAKEIRLAKKGMRITLDGIAKGYAVDLIAEDIERQGYYSYVLNFSGNMRWHGHREDGTYWKIDQWNPVTKKSAPLPHAESGAIASSGREHSGDHILDPRTRKPTKPTWAQTTVRGPSAEICDVLSTTTFILSKSEIKVLLSKHFQGYVVDAIDLNGVTHSIQTN